MIHGRAGRSKKQMSACEIPAYYTASGDDSATLSGLKADFYRAGVNDSSISDSDKQGNFQPIFAMINYALLVQFKTPA